MLPEYYNNDYREIEGKLEIYFNGDTDEPLVVDRDTYLIDFQVLEEVSAEDKNPLGAISANELTFTLVNFDNIFSPQNIEGPYYGKIITGVKVKPFIRPVGEEVWEPLGEYHVADWKGSLGSATVFVSCYDVVQDLLLTDVPDIDVQFNTTFEEFFKYILQQYGYDDAIVDPALSNDALPYGLIEYTSTAELLQSLAEASMSYIMTTRSGNVEVKKLKVDTPVDTFTDNKQLMSADVETSIIKTYGGVKLTYVLPQLSDDIKVLVVDSLTIPVGVFSHNFIRYEKPVLSISAVAVYGKGTCEVQSYVSTVFGLKLVTNLKEKESIPVKLIVTGKNFSLVEQELNDNTTNMLEIYNPYIQYASYATVYKSKLEKFVKSDMPQLDLVIRGNPAIHIGDTVKIQSTRYNLDFTGIVKQSVLKYDGSLTCTMSLFNAEVIA